MFRVRCECGEEVAVPAVKAGGAVACLCGRQVLVPSLSVLRSYAAREEAAPCSQSPHSQLKQGSQPAAARLPETAIVHCCGSVSSTGNVSPVAIQNYVGVLLQGIERFVAANPQVLNSELVLSCALLPAVRPWLDIEAYPPGAESAWLNELTELLLQTPAPPVMGQPVGFAIYRRLHSRAPLLNDFTPFRNLGGAITARELQTALLQAAGAVDAGPKQKLTRWPGAQLIDAYLAILKRYGARWKSQLKKQELPHTTPVELTPAEVFERQEAWLSKVEALAQKCSFPEVKQAAAEEPNELHSHIALAAKHLQGEHWELAIAAYDRALQLDSSWAAIYDRRARVWQLSGNSQAALADLTQAIELAPFAPDMRQRRAEIYTSLGAWDKAREDLDAAQRSAPYDPTICLFRGQLLMQLEQPQQALEQLERALALDPNSGRAHFLVGWHYEMGAHPDRQRSIEHFTRAIELVPEDTASLVYRSLAYLAESKYALALDDCDRILQLDPSSSTVLAIRGRILQLEGDYDGAIEACSAAIDAGIEQAMVYLARAISYAATEQTELARADCEMAIGLEPDNALARHLHGQLLLNEGDLEAAMEDFRRARELAPDWAEPREHLAYVHRMNEDPQAAVDEQSALIEEYPRQASHYVNRAFAYGQLAHYELAARDFDRAIELDTENDQIYYLRGCFRVERQDYDRALADFSHVLKLTGEHDAARLQRAGVYIYLKQYQTAVEDYAQLIAKHPDDPRAYSGRAYALRVLGENNAAEADVERLTELLPEEAERISLQKLTAEVVRLRQATLYEEAQRIAEDVIALAPSEPIGFRIRAGLHWDLEEFVEAVEDYTRALELEAEHSEEVTHSILSSRGQVQAEMGEWELALLDLERAVELSRNAGENVTLAFALNGRALAFAQLNRMLESDRDYEESVQLCPSNPWVYYHRGMQTFDRGEHFAAKVLLELALELTDPPLPLRKQQRARLALRKISTNSDFASE